MSMAMPSARAAGPSDLSRASASSRSSIPIAGSYAERAYFDGDACQHIADRDEAQRLKAKRETARKLLRDPFDPASYRHICNDRNAAGAARMAKLIAPYLERK